MAAREVIFLGTSSQVPTRSRAHNAFFLRWDDLGVLFDPGEGTQRQMIHAGLTASQITHIAITHFHGDHCLGLAGMTQRIALDRVPHEVPVYFPASGRPFFDRLTKASIFQDTGKVVPRPIEKEGEMARIGELSLHAAGLEHGVDCFGYRLVEPDGRHMDPVKLEAAGIRGPDVGRLLREGSITAAGRTVRVEDVSEHRPGQVFAAVMDSRPCPGAASLAQEADLLVCESTYLAAEGEEARSYRHMTAVEAATLAKEAGVRRLALTHFSQRYTDLKPFREEAAAIHPDVFVASDLATVAVPPRK